jgi:hypothetical protein
MKITPRAAAFPAVPMIARNRVGVVTAWFPSPARAANTGAIPAPVEPRRRSGCWATHGSPTDRMGRAHRAANGSRAAAGGRPGGVRQRIPPACPPPIRRAARGFRRVRVAGEGAGRDRAVSYGSRASPSRQSQLTASCGCVREAPPKNLTLRSGRERAATLAAPTGDDRASGTGAHPQAEAMHAGSAPVIRLEGPLALGHDVLLVVLPSGRSDVSHRARLRFDRRWSWCCWPARSPGGSGRSRIADFRATVRGYLRGFAWSNLACRNEAAHARQKDSPFRSHSSPTWLP